MTVPRGKWTEQQITTILTMLALNAGNVAKTIRDFKAENGGSSPNPETLTSWRDRVYVERYSKIRDEYAREFEAEAVRTFRDRMKQAGEAEALAVQRALEQLEMNRVSAKDLAPMAYNMSRIKSANATQLLTYTGRPSQIIDDRSAQKVVESLLRKKVLRLVSDAEHTASDTNMDSEDVA